MYFLTSQSNQRILLILFFCVIATIPLIPIFSNSAAPNLPDYFNHLALIIQAKIALASGQFPLRIAPLEFYGKLYPTYQFYSPTSYLISGIIYQWVTPSSPWLAYKLTLWLGLVVGTGFIYKLSNYLTNAKSIALLSSLFYVTTPYYILLINNRGAFNEALGLGVLPMVLFFTLQLNNKVTLNSLLLAGMSWFLLITIHLITFTYFSLCLFILLLMNSKSWRNYCAALLGLGLGALLACWYLAPVLLLQPYLYINSTYNFSTQLLPSWTMLLSPVISLQYPGLYYTAIGWPILLSATLGLYALYKKPLHTLYGCTPLSLFILFFILLGLIFTSAWTHLPYMLRVGQYSARLCAQLTWVGTLLFAYTLNALFKSQLQNKWFILIIAFVISVGQIIWIGVVMLAGLICLLLKNLSLRKQRLSGFIFIALFFMIIITLPNHSSYTWLHYDSYTWLLGQKHQPLRDIINNPTMRFSRESYLINPEKFRHYLPPNLATASVQACQMTNQIQHCEISVSGNIKFIALPILFYPHLLKVVLNGKPINYQALLDKEKKYLQIATRATAGNNIIQVQFIGLTPANIISKLSWLLWSLLILSSVIKFFYDIITPRAITVKQAFNYE